MMAGVVAFLVLALLALLIFGLAWVGSWDRGPNPRETFDLQDRKRRAEAMRVAEGGLCCCHEHGTYHCRVHASEGEALPPQCRCTHASGHPTHCYPDRCYGISRDTAKHGGGL